MVCVLDRGASKCSSSVTLVPPGGATIRKGSSTVATGKGGPIAKGRAVQLQVGRSGLCYWVATTHENTGGAFSFTIKGSATGTRDYRAFVSDFAGYLQYGYSVARALKVS